MPLNFFQDPVWDQTLWNNTYGDYAMALVWFAGLLVVLWLVQLVILARARQLAKRTASTLDDAAVKIASSIRPPFYFGVALFGAIRSLTLSPLATKVVNGLLAIIITYQVVVSLQIIIDLAARRRLRQRAAADPDEGPPETDKNLESALKLINRIAAVMLWAVGILFVLSNFGINVSSLIASLGIGGIAVALAAQNILGDLFSSLSIYFDKPFKIGETIKVDGVIGTVKHIGIKTTRIKALSGEEVVMPNRKLTDAQIQNFKRMEKRRIAFDLGVAYETPSDKLEQVPALIEQAFADLNDVDFSRAHFKDFGDSALIFEVVYHLTDSSYDLYMDRQQQLNFNLKRALNDAGITIAYPTQTIYLHQANSKQVA